MKVGDRFVVYGKEYEAVGGNCCDCAFKNDGKNCCPTLSDGFNCLTEENRDNGIIAKEVSK